MTAAMTQVPVPTAKPFPDAREVVFCFKSRFPTLGKRLKKEGGAVRRGDSAALLSPGDWLLWHSPGACPRDYSGCIDIDERRVIPDIEIREAVIKACGLRSISDFQLLTLERRKSVIQEVMRSLDVRPRQLSRVTGMNYETIRNIAKKLP